MLDTNPLSAHALWEKQKNYIIEYTLTLPHREVPKVTPMNYSLACLQARSGVVVFLPRDPRSRITQKFAEAACQLLASGASETSMGFTVKGWEGWNLTHLFSIGFS